MIHVNATHDAQVWPNGVLAYRAKVVADKEEQTDGSYRLWWVEHAPHGAPHDGVTAQALRDLVAWVEQGTGRFERFEVDGSLPSVTVETTHAYARPGTYLACFRVGSHRDGAAGTKPYARNNARVRVVVSES